MKTRAGIAVIGSWLCISQIGFAEALPEGTWSLNADGVEASLVLKVGEGGRVTGTTHGGNIVGWYDAGTSQLNFVRMVEPNRPSFHSYQGHLAVNTDAQGTRYTLAGTFIPSDPSGSTSGAQEMGWYAQMEKPSKPVAAAHAPLHVTKLIEGDWNFNHGGYEGRLVIKLEGEKVSGTVFGDPITGSFDPVSKRIIFLRMCVPNDPLSFQTHKGYLFANQIGNKNRYNLAGTVGNIVNPVMFGWFAQIDIEYPVTGNPAPGVESIDAVMIDSLRKTDFTAATVTIARGDQILYSRGYGWSDRECTVPIQPDTPMIIASCDKPITGAMIKKLAREGKVDMNASVLRFLDTKPAGEVVDPRVWDITFQHLFDSRAGWQGEPIAKAWKEYNGGIWPLESFEGLLSHAMTQKLAWAPGEKQEYDSFGFNILKTVITRISGRSYDDYLRHELCRPYGVEELKWVRSDGPPRDGEPAQLWNGLIFEDPKEYRMGVSTPALCTFMRCYWINGEPIESKENRPVAYNGVAGGMSQTNWRADGINIAWTFNVAGNADPGTPLDKTIDRLIKEKRLPK